jgi:FHS family L-fucose permease-like MFS transporter
MAGGVNNFGTTIGPLIVSFAIFGALSVDGSKNIASISAVKTPYLILGAAFLIVAVIFKFSSLPNKIELEEDAAISSPTDVSYAAHEHAGTAKKSAFNYTQLVMGMIGIFVYVGVEVSTASNLPEFMKQKVNMPTESIAPYISLYWASLMIGRWTGSVGVFDVSKGTLQILKFVMPYLAFGVFLLVNKIANHDLTPFYFCILYCLHCWFSHLFRCFKSKRWRYFKPDGLQKRYCAWACYFGAWHLTVLSCCRNVFVSFNDHRVIYCRSGFFVATNCC